MIPVNIHLVTLRKKNEFSIYKNADFTHWIQFQETSTYPCSIFQYVTVA